MANMSYCAAENTLRAVEQLNGLIDDGEKDDDVVAKRHEYRALRDLLIETDELQERIEYLLDKHAQ